MVKKITKRIVGKERQSEAYDRAFQAGKSAVWNMLCVGESRGGSDINGFRPSEKCNLENYISKNLNAYPGPVYEELYGSGHREDEVKHISEGLLASTSRMGSKEWKEKRLNPWKEKQMRQAKNHFSVVASDEAEMTAQIENVEQQLKDIKDFKGAIGFTKMNNTWASWPNSIVQTLLTIPMPKWGKQSALDVMVRREELAEKSAIGKRRVALGEIPVTPQTKFESTEKTNLVGRLHDVSSDIAKKFGETKEDKERAHVVLTDFVYSIADEKMTPEQRIRRVESTVSLLHPEMTKSEVSNKMSEYVSSFASDKRVKSIQEDMKRSVELQRSLSPIMQRVDKIWKSISLSLTPQGSASYDALRVVRDSLLNGQDFMKSLNGVIVDRCDEIAYQQGIPQGSLRGDDAMVWFQGIYKSFREHPAMESTITYLVADKLSKSSEVARKTASTQAVDAISQMVA